MQAKCLTIAGSDSGGGAGIQADLKTFTVLGTYGASVITALTAQNTLGVQGILPVDAAFVEQQLNAVLDDIGADAVKTGMLMNAEIVKVVAANLERRGMLNLVVDPVMVAKSGDRLLLPEAVEALRDRLLPLATIVTPNTEEAALLAGMETIDDYDSALEAAEIIRQCGPAAVLIKGGHLSGPTCNDIFCDGDEPLILEAERRDQRHTHGTGCTLSAALAAFLARGCSPRDAAREAKEYLTGAIAAARPLGGGIGPVNHTWRS
jgi:hydroxymethylpyrimidine/phosphomethylpyrimidine kinase